MQKSERDIQGASTSYRYKYARRASVSTPKKSFGKLILVSNRLPVSLENLMSGTPCKFNMELLNVKKSYSSLYYAFSKFNDKTSAIQEEDSNMSRESPLGIHQLSECMKQMVWVGWVGENDIIPEFEGQNFESEGAKTNCHLACQEKKREIEKHLIQCNHFIPIFLTQHQIQHYYNGFCNSVLYPLFFNVCGQSKVHFDTSEWEVYQQVNQLFTKKILEVYEDGDMIWIHDFHLCLVPSLLRSKKPNIRVGFFFHSPFPTSEIYRILPVRSEILEGVLGSNLVGFQTFNFARHFLSSCSRTLGVECTPNGVSHKGLLTHVEVFPVGIDVNEYMASVKSATKYHEIPKLQGNIIPNRKKEKREKSDSLQLNHNQHFKFDKSFKDKIVILGIDRLDYTKGLDLKLRAFEKFLCLHPEAKEKVMLVQVAMPPRKKCPEYAAIEKEVNRLVGRINSIHGTLEGFPIYYIQTVLPFEEICTLYAAADIMLVSSVRDGMNLVSLEFVCCQEAANKHGVILLSEFAGASSSLNGALLINPFDIEGTARSIALAVNMEEKERKIRHEHNFAVVSKNSAHQWMQSFLTLFTKFVMEHEHSEGDIPPVLDCNEFSACYAQQIQGDSKRLMLLDYEGTLIDVKKYPYLSFPSKECFNLLNNLCSDKNNIVFLITERDAISMQHYFGAIKGLGLVAEFGVACRYPNEEEWKSLYHTENIPLTWIKDVTPLLKQATFTIPGSHLIQTSSNLIFDYSNSDPIFADWQACELKTQIEQMKLSVEICHITGKRKYLLIRPSSVSKGVAVQRIIEKYEHQIGMLFVAGDDRLDEDMFEYVHHKWRKDFSGQKEGGQDSIMTVFSCNIGGNSKTGTWANYRLGSPTQLRNLLHQQTTKKKITSSP